MALLTSKYFLVFFFFPFLASADVKKFPVPSGGPESYMFDSKGGGPYTGANDGRIVKYGGPKVGWVDFAYASPTRTKKLCDGTTDPQMGNICGRTLGLGFDYNNNKLYIADAYHGLCVVGPKGGRAKQLLSSVEGLPLKWLDGLAVDQKTGKVYFTDVSTKYNLSQVQEHLATGDSTGRFIEYDPKTKKARVLLKDLQGAGGAGVSLDGSFVLLSEFVRGRITKYWLTGPKTDTAKLLMDISGPANLKITPAGDYWVATNIKEPGYSTPIGVKIDKNGKILKRVPFGPKLANVSITEVQEHGGALFVASIYVSYGATYTASN